MLTLQSFQLSVLCQLRQKALRGAKRGESTATLFMLMSVDGKISMGAANDLDGDKNLPNIAPLVWNRISI